MSRKFYYSTIPIELKPLFFESYRSSSKTWRQICDTEYNSGRGIGIYKLPASVDANCSQQPIEFQTDRKGYEHGIINTAKFVPLYRFFIAMIGMYRVLLAVCLYTASCSMIIQGEIQYGK